MSDTDEAIREWRKVCAPSCPACAALKAALSRKVEPKPGVNIRHSDGITGYVPKRIRHSES